MTMAATDTKPWYKQFWPWFVLAIPGAAVVMGIALVYVASQNKVSMVKDDYYKEGKAINQRIDKLKRASELGLTASLSFSRDTGDFLVSIPQLQDTGPATLRLALIHPTLENRDEVITLTRAPGDTYWAKLDPGKNGYFNVQLTNPGLDWELYGAINFNNRQVDLTLTAE
ncbi:MAG: FixH family protein [Ketobacteraceae bacterium]|nr:FixH family protein [Ketobacteraceae bacterium]